jgi:hypothetical protein
VSAARPKKGIFRLHRAKAGQAPAPVPDRFRRRFSCQSNRRVPAEPIDVNEPQLEADRVACDSRIGVVVLRAPENIDHDFVIEVSGRNKLKD